MWDAWVGNCTVCFEAVEWENRFRGILVNRYIAQDRAARARSVAFRVLRGRYGTALGVGGSALGRRLLEAALTGGRFRGTFRIRKVALGTAGRLGEERGWWWALGLG